MALLIQINWFNYGDYKIIDVHEKLYNEVQNYMLEHFRCQRLFQVLKIPLEMGIEEEFLKLVKHILQNECSIVVMDKSSNSIKGVALLKCMTQDWRSWTSLQLLIESERFKELCDMVRWCLQQQAVKHKHNPGGDTLHLFSFHLCEDLEEDQEFMYGFFNVICEVARHMHMPRVTYLCLSQTDHESLESAGFKEMVRVIYSMYVFNGRRPFDRLRDISEMYGIFYEKKVEALKPYYEMVVRHAGGKENKEVQKKSQEVKVNASKEK